MSYNRKIKKSIEDWEIKTNPQNKKLINQFLNVVKTGKKLNHQSLNDILKLADKAIRINGKPFSKTYEKTILQAKKAGRKRLPNIIKGINNTERKIKVKFDQKKK